jgi:DnaJ-class molecular chaperone
MKVFFLFGACSHTGQGVDAGPDQPKGHLFIQVVVEPDPYFTRDGLDLHVELPVPVSTALLGGAVDVVTLDGMAKLTIPSGNHHKSLAML